jgi:hypothetical protein
MTQLIEIEAHILGMGELLDIVGAMRSLASMRVQEAQRALPAIRRYAQTMADAIGAALLLVPESAAVNYAATAQRALVLCTAEHGFVAGFNERVLDAAETLLDSNDALFVLGSCGGAGAGLVDGIWLPIDTRSMSFVGSESRSIKLAASFAAMVPECITSPTSAWASAGASLVPSPVIATRRPWACSRRIRRSFSSGFASATKSSTPACAATARAVTGLSPVTIMVRIPISRSRLMRSPMPGFGTSDNAITRRTCPSTDTAKGVAPRFAPEPNDKHYRIMYLYPEDRIS